MRRHWFILSLLLTVSSIAVSQGYNAASATAISPGSSVSGIGISDNSKYQYWSITTVANGYLRIQVTSTSAIDVDVNLWESDTTITVMTDGGSGVNSEVYGFLKPGKYYLRVWKWQGVSGSYSITTSFSQPSRSPETEPNNYASSALSLAPTDLKTGHIGFSGGGSTDLDDYWKVTTTEDGWLRVQVRSDSLDLRNEPGIYLDLDAWLYDIDSTATIWNDGRYGTFSQVSGFVRPGTYYVKVHKWLGRAGSYEIKSDFFPPPLANDAEGNDTYQTASTVLVNSTVTGHLGYLKGGFTDTQDFWKFVVPNDGKITVQVTSDSADRSGAILDLDLAIYDMNGTSSIASDGSYGKFSECIAYLQPGTFYVRVNRWQGNAGSYTMTLTHTPPPRPNDVGGNDWFSTATAFTYGVSSSGHMGYSANGVRDTRDLWKLVAPATDSIYVHVWSDATIDVDVSAYASDTTSSVTSDAGYGVYSRVGIKATAGSTYYFKVNYWSGTAGSYSISANRSYIATGIEQNTKNKLVPLELALEQNYPNPFNPSTTIRYDLPETQHAKITVFSLLGQEIAELVNMTQSPGSYRVVWNGKDQQGKDMPSGMYLIRLQAGSSQLVRKAMLVR